MPVKKQQNKTSSSRRPARAVGARGSANPAPGRRAREDADPVVDERAIARKNTKPRSARESVKGPSQRKASPSGKSAKR